MIKTNEDIFQMMLKRLNEIQLAIYAEPQDYVFGWIESTLCVGLNDNGTLRVMSADKAPSANELKSKGINVVKNGAGFYAKRVERMTMLKSELASVNLSLDYFAKHRD